MIRNRGSLFVVSAPSGAGKTSLCRKLCETLPGIRFSVSYTTRKPREGEVNGKHYFFVSPETFRAMITADEFVEWAEVFGNYYGTSAGKIEEMMAAGTDVILDIDVQGAMQIQKRVPDSRLVFIMPPSMKVLRERLAGRMTDSEDAIVKRLAKARDEMKEYKKYNYVIINDTFDIALADLYSVVTAERVTMSKANQDVLDRLISEEGE